MHLNSRLALALARIRQAHRQLLDTAGHEPTSDNVIAATLVHAAA